MSFGTQNQLFLCLAFVSIFIPWINANSRHVWSMFDKEDKDF